jgi:hypothetical protein
MTGFVGSKQPFDYLQHLVGSTALRLVENDDAIQFSPDGFLDRLVH